MFQQRAVLGGICVLLVVSGCMKINKAEVAPYPLGTPKMMSVVPRTGFYSVRWAVNPTAALQRLEGTDAMLVVGESAGFETNEDGEIVAVGGPRKFTIPNLPEQAKYLVWYHHERQRTQFSREVDKAAEAGGQVAAVAGTAALIGGIVLGTAYLESQIDDDHCNKCGSHCHCHSCHCH